MTTLAEVAKTMKGLGKAKIHIDRAKPELIIEALTKYKIHRYTSYEDAQIIGTFHVYEVWVDGVEITLETTKKITVEEAKESSYTGLSVEELRKLKKTNP